MLEDSTFGDGGFSQGSYRHWAESQYFPQFWKLHGRLPHEEVFGAAAIFDPPGLGMRRSSIYSWRRRRTKPPGEPECASPSPEWFSQRMCTHTRSVEHVLPSFCLSPQMDSDDPMAQCMHQFPKPSRFWSLVGVESL